MSTVAQGDIPWESFWKGAILLTRVPEEAFSLLLEFLDTGSLCDLRTYVGSCTISVLRGHPVERLNLHLTRTLVDRGHRAVQHRWDRRCPPNNTDRTLVQRNNEHARLALSQVSGTLDRNTLALYLERNQPPDYTIGLYRRFGVRNDLGLFQ